MQKACQMSGIEVRGLSGLGQRLPNQEFSPPESRFHHKFAARGAPLLQKIAGLHSASQSLRDLRSSPSLLQRVRLRNQSSISRCARRPAFAASSSPALSTIASTCRRSTRLATNSLPPLHHVLLRLHNPEYQRRNLPSRRSRLFKSRHPVNQITGGCTRRHQAASPALALLRRRQASCRRRKPPSADSSAARHCSS